MTNPFGYTAAFIVEYTAFWYVHCNIACMISLGFGSFLLSIALIKHTKRNIHVINKDINFRMRRLHTSEKLSQFIQFHATLKQLSFVWNFCLLEHWQSVFFYFNTFRTVCEFSDIYQPIIMSLFLWCLMTICGTMLLLQYGLVEFIAVFIILIINFI